jgi:hypothetical protein
MIEIGKSETYVVFGIEFVVGRASKRLYWCKVDGHNKECFGKTLEDVIGSWLMWYAASNPRLILVDKPQEASNLTAALDEIERLMSTIEQMERTHKVHLASCSSLNGLADKTIDELRLENRIYKQTIKVHNSDQCTQCPAQVLCTRKPDMGCTGVLIKHYTANPSELPEESK